MIDENAFGILISYFGIEDDEYGLERDDFVERCETFRRALGEWCRELDAGDSLRVLDLGHAWYLEFADGDQTGDPVSWLKSARARLADVQIHSACILTYGSRWVGESPSEPPEIIGRAPLLVAARSSEPLRRALYADTAVQIDDDEPDQGWGPGVYIDTEAVDALGRKLKNAPTPLKSAGATFFRIGK